MQQTCAPVYTAPMVGHGINLIQVTEYAHGLGRSINVQKAAHLAKRAELSSNTLRFMVLRPFEWSQHHEPQRVGLLL